MTRGTLMAHSLLLERFEDKWIQSCYRPQTKLREGNGFTGICLFTVGLPSHNALYGKIPLPRIQSTSEVYATYWTYPKSYSTKTFRSIGEQ